MKKEILISAHNPVTGPRHLGHYFGAMKSLVECQHDYQTIVVLDDLLAHFMYPHEREFVRNRTFYVVQDFINSGFDVSKHSIVLTSQISSYFVEHMLYYGSVVDVEYCNHLYENSFLGSLKSYQRKELGLGFHPTVTEWLYPQIGIASMTLSMGAKYFQGGEEIIGYIYIMEEIIEKFKKRTGLDIDLPQYVPSKVGYINGVDNKYMIQKNCVFLSESIESITEKINSIKDKKVFIDWYECLHMEAKSKELAERDFTENDRKEFLDVLLAELKPFRDNKMTNEQIIEVLNQGRDKVKLLFNETLVPLKESLNVYTL
jgi:tryptophanyl-tRNA synthetase